MKENLTFRCIALIFSLIVAFSAFVACGDSGDDTTKAPETTHHTHVFGEAEEIKAPTCTEKGRKVATCSCGKTEYVDVPALGHDYVDGTCKNCNDVLVHVHAFTANKCSCGISGFSVTDSTFGLDLTVAKDSRFDGNKDGANDKFNFASTLAEKFSATGAISIPSANYDKIDSKNPSSNVTSYPGLPHYYITEFTDQTLVYKITVEEAGVYDMAIHMRLKDLKERGNKFTVNPDTAGEYSFETSFKPASDDEIALMKLATDGKDSTYMYGMQIYLNEGENILLIQATTTEKCQHFRNFYFVKAS